MPIHTTIAFFAVPSTCGGGKLTFHSARGRMHVYDCFIRTGSAQAPVFHGMLTAWPPWQAASAMAGSTQAAEPLQSTRLGIKATMIQTWQSSIA